MDWHMFFIGYFMVSAVLTTIIAHANKNFSPGNEGLTWVDLGLLFIFSPIFLAIMIITHLVNPASGDAFDIIYTKLSYSEGKDKGQLLDEIRRANESIGGWEKISLSSNLDVMVQRGYARKKINPLHIDMIEAVKKSRTSIGVPVSDQDIEEAYEDVLPNFYVYLKGLPPKKRKLKDRILEWLPGWQPDPTRA